ncbi:MAG: ATP-binding protein [Tissierellia bacterium]|nr:ATP-binding protein [Tissierellia bacterium]
MGKYIGDENRIRQVLINLIDNSIKFTPKGGNIYLRGYREEDFIILEVEDNGKGIDVDDLPHVKEKFYKGKHAGSKTGIGLSVSDEIIKLHGGKLNVESEVDNFTIIKATLPVQEEDI